MMGQQPGIQPKIFYHYMNLEQRVPRTHLLRKIQEQIDFNFIYAEVRGAYGLKGTVFTISLFSRRVLACSFGTVLIFFLNNK